MRYFILKAKDYAFYDHDRPMGMFLQEIANNYIDTASKEKHELIDQGQKTNNIRVNVDRLNLDTKETDQTEKQIVQLQEHRSQASTSASPKPK